jgi:hypothetical protein
MLPYLFIFYIKRDPVFGSSPCFTCAPARSDACPAHLAFRPGGPSPTKQRPTLTLASGSPSLVTPPRFTRARRSVLCLRLGGATSERCGARCGAAGGALGMGAALRARRDALGAVRAGRRCGLELQARLEGSVWHGSKD